MSKHDVFNKFAFSRTYKCAGTFLKLDIESGRGWEKEREKKKVGDMHINRHKVDMERKEKRERERDGDKKSERERHTHTNWIWRERVGDTCIYRYKLNM